MSERSDRLKNESEEIDVEIKRLQRSIEAYLISGMRWISVKKELPSYDYLCVVRHYNGHMEIACYDGVSWWEQSNSFEKSDTKMTEEAQPDWWFKLEDPNDLT